MKTSSYQGINLNLNKEKDPYYNKVNPDLIALAEKSNMTVNDIDEMIKIFKEDKEQFFAKDKYGESTLYCLFKNESAQIFDFNSIWEVVLFHEKNDLGFAQKVIESQIKYDANATTLYHTALNRNLYFKNNEIDSNLLKTALDIFSNYDISPDFSDGLNTKLIEQAIYSENIEQVKILIERDPECINRQNDFQETPTHKLTQLINFDNKSKEIFKLMTKTILEIVPTKIKIELLVNNQGYTPFINSDNIRKSILIEGLQELAEERQENHDFAIQHQEIDFGKLAEALGNITFKEYTM
ncbi:MAG: hypothetical protein U1E31_02200 [Rickettsiales bacterium]